jgi:hypothetical protein
LRSSSLGAGRADATRIDLDDAINSISLGVLGETKVFTRVLRVGIYGAVYTSVSIAHRAGT